MGRVLRWLGYGALGLIALALIGAVAIFGISQTTIGKAHAAKPERLLRPTAAQLADGARQARILGCYSCHGEGLAGRVMEDIPNVIRVYAPNLTELAAGATDQQLAAAIRQGIGVDGRPLFVMPSPMYSRLGDGEIGALIAHIRSLPRSAGPADSLTFGPIGRFAVAMGKIRPVPAKLEEFRTQAPIDLGPAHAAGRRLAAINCSECHGPALYGMTMEEGAVTPDLTIAAGYDAGQFRTLMRTGKAPHGRDLGLMAFVSRNDFRHYTDAEIAAIHTYLAARAERLGS